MVDPDPHLRFGFPVGPWHDHFAWFPIRTYDDRLVWLRRVRRRRRIQKHFFLDGGPDSWWQYHCEAGR